MQQQVLIRNGSYRNMPVTDTVFTLVKEYTEGAKSNYITVDGTEHAGMPDGNIRVTVKSPDYFELVKDGEVVESATSTKETDEQVIERLRERFQILEDMTYASCDGVVRGMVVTGPPGVGKSYGVEKVIREAELMNKMGGGSGNTGRKYGMEKGAASPIGLFKLLYEYAEAGSVLVLDDCDSVLYDETSLNLLKAALDSSPKRFLSWRSESRALVNEGIPDRFEFKGSIIFITNLKFDKTRGKMKDHLDAIMSRCHYLDLTLDTMRDKFLRCKQIVKDGMLQEYNFSQDEQDKLLDYIFSNRDKIREMSLRMVLKIADLKRMNGDKWQRYVEMTCMKRA
jgi:hypothetical protein